MSTESRKPTKDEIETTVTRIRHRGFTNALFDEVSQAFEAANPGLKVVWEYSPPNSPDQIDVRRREMYGFRIVTEDELPQGSIVPHTQEGGEVRVSDSVMMCAPKEIYDAYYAEDFQEAREDAMLPEQEYLNQIQERGATKLGQGKAYGKISHGSRVLSVDIGKAEEGGT